MEPESIQLGRGYGFHEFPPEIQNNPDILKKVPRCQALSLERYTYPQDPRPVIVHIRWTNKICFQCHRKDHQMKFYPCPSCQLAFYCSQACFERHQPAHQKECGNVDCSEDQISFGGRLCILQGTQGT